MAIVPGTNVIARELTAAVLHAVWNLAAKGVSDVVVLEQIISTSGALQPRSKYQHSHQ